MQLSTLQNEELRDLYLPSDLSIIRIVKFMRFRCAGHVAETKNECRIFSENHVRNAFLEDQKNRRG